MADMPSLAVSIDVPDLARGAGENGHFRRVVGLLDDNETLAIAAMTAGAKVADTELSFRLDDARALAEACLSGDRRALTTPGIARILSATACYLFRVSLAAGAVQQIPGGERDGYFRDQQPAGEDEDPCE